MPDRYPVRGIGRSGAIERRDGPEIPAGGARLSIHKPETGGFRASLQKAAVHRKRRWTTSTGGPLRSIVDDTVRTGRRTAIAMVLLRVLGTGLPASMIGHGTDHPVSAGSCGETLREARHSTDGAALAGTGGWHGGGIHARPDREAAAIRSRHRATAVTWDAEAAGRVPP